MGRTVWWRIIRRGKSSIDSRAVVLKFQHVLKIIWKAVKTDWWAPFLASLRWDLRICIPDKLPDAADAAGLGSSHFRVLLL